MQKALDRGFTLAARWNAVFLLDEADAFLSKREGSDLKRNALVAGMITFL